MSFSSIFGHLVKQIAILVTGAVLVSTFILLFVGDISDDFSQMNIVFRLIIFYVVGLVSVGIYQEAQSKHRTAS